MNLLYYAQNLNDTNVLKQSLNEMTTTSKTIAVGNSGIISRFGIMYKNNGIQKVPFFLNSNSNSNFNKYNWFSDDFISFLINYKITILDIICCNMFIKSFIEETIDIYNKYGITINHSMNRIGNINNANWILEVSNNFKNPDVNIDIKSLYFTDGILNWKYDLDTSDLINHSQWKFILLQIITQCNT